MNRESNSMRCEKTYLPCCICSIVWSIPGEGSVLFGLMVSQVTTAPSYVLMPLRPAPIAPNLIQVLALKLPKCQQPKFQSKSKVQYIPSPAPSPSPQNPTLVYLNRITYLTSHVVKGSTYWLRCGAFCARDVIVRSSSKKTIRAASSHESILATSFIVLY